MLKQKPYSTPAPHTELNRLKAKNEQLHVKVLSTMIDIAEQVNGIIKTDWLYTMSIPTVATAVTLIIGAYNTKRPHMSVGMLSLRDRYKKEKFRFLRCFLSERTLFSGFKRAFSAQQGLDSPLF